MAADLLYFWTRPNHLHHCLRRLLQQLPYFLQCRTGMNSMLGCQPFVLIYLEVHACAHTPEVLWHAMWAAHFTFLIRLVA